MTSSYARDQSDNGALRCEGVWKLFQRGRRIVKALTDVSLEIRRGEFVCLTGPSGSGKSTLLNLLGALDVPTKGDVYGLGQRYGQFTNEESNRFRREHVGFVFQELRLVEHLTATENVMLPRLFDGVSKATLEESAIHLLEQVQLADRKDHYPYELSYGERQRVAIARAVVTKPQIILADEPTANLDDLSTDRVLEVFRAFMTEDRTLVVSTHDPRVLSSAQRVIRIEGGAVVTGTARI